MTTSRPNKHRSKAIVARLHDAEAMLNAGDDLNRRERRRGATGAARMFWFAGPAGSGLENGGSTLTSRSSARKWLRTCLRKGDWPDYP
jgi:hypothetical protein